MNGADMLGFATQLYPICRSITGEGLRKTLRLIGERIPLSMTEIPSGAGVYDWTVPDEWNIEDAWVKDPHGRKVVDFASHNLHLVGYSEPLRTHLQLTELRDRIHTLETQPDWIPYRTSYYRRNWGFCMRHRDAVALQPGRYQVHINSRLEPGSLTIGEFHCPGETRREVLLFTHVCHPSLANDNLSGIVVATQLARWLSERPRRYTYRIVFAPGTIGALCWLKRNEGRLGRIEHGLVLCLLGDSGAFTYKRSRRGDAEMDSIAAHVLGEMEPNARVMPFDPYGYSERQFCSPGFDLPIGRLTRSVDSGYPEYHTSADDLSLLDGQRLERSVELLRRIVTVIEENRTYVNLAPRGEPRLGKVNLYQATGGRSPGERERALFWVLNQSDGANSLLQISQRSAMPFTDIQAAAQALVAVKLLRVKAPVARQPSAAPVARQPSAAPVARQRSAASKARKAGAPRSSRAAPSTARRGRPGGRRKARK